MPSLSTLYGHALWHAPDLEVSMFTWLKCCDVTWPVGEHSLQVGTTHYFFTHNPDLFSLESVHMQCMKSFVVLTYSKGGSCVFTTGGRSLFQNMKRALQWIAAGVRPPRSNRKSQNITELGCYKDTTAKDHSHKCICVIFHYLALQLPQL